MLFLPAARLPVTVKYAICSAIVLIPEPAAPPVYGVVPSYVVLRLEARHGQGYFGTVSWEMENK